jgi:hypothetical protein
MAAVANEITTSFIFTIPRFKKNRRVDFDSGGLRLQQLQRSEARYTSRMPSANGKLRTILPVAA